MQVSKLFQNTLNNGGQLLQDGSAYAFRKSKYYPNRFIQRFIYPDGSYTIQVVENNNLVKRVFKSNLKNNSTLTDSWDYTKNKGVHLSNVVINDGKSLMSRVFDKVGERNISGDGYIYLHHSGKSDKYITEVRTLDGIVSTAKPFNPMGWLNDKFYEFFNK